MALPNTNIVNTVKRVRLAYGLLIVVVAVFVLRLFYLQVIRYDHYKQAALSDQLKQYQIPATRGLIEAHDGNAIVPIVLNQQLFTLYADPTFIKNPDNAASRLVPIIGGKAQKYADLMKTPNTRYVVLAKQLSDSQSQQLLALKIPGIGTQAQDYRTYPDGKLAAQVLGFVNADGKGTYGLEQALNHELSGTPGEVKAVTDANGVPLAATKGNVETAPQNGNNIITTLDISMQTQLEQILASEYQKTHSKGLSALIMEPNTGQIKAMANYPTYDPANYQKVSDPAVFQNAAITNAIEPGSTMKVLTTSAALDQGAITPNETFYDPAHWLVNGFNITDIEEDGGARQQSVASTLALSLNTGATWMLMQMSNPGQNKITQHGIDAWRNYLVNHFRFGKPTGIEQGYESPGVVPSANPQLPARALTFANTAFGQGIQVTALQMGAALSSVLNGGTYYQPTLIDQTVTGDGKTVTNHPKALEQNVVKSSTGKELEPLMENVVTTYLHEGYSFMRFPSQYMVGGKTGTAQIAKPTGGYFDNIFNGTYMGFVGGNKPQYVIVVFNIQPNVPGYAGALGGQPVFADLAHMLINNSFVTPKTH
ncbi:MAG TPA: penicillin-binding protein 2 [Candidatus Saccharimonadales bacterium]|nr:penicillin-binding protein 2 [Candidatus Saccharimonadales bacterium]